MSDPFEFLNPIASTKPSGEKMLHPPRNASTGAPFNSVTPINGMGIALNGNMHLNTSMNMGGTPSAFNTGNMSTMPFGGTMPSSAFPGALGAVPGMYQSNPFGQQPPVMYDNIKKLLEKKPVLDDVSMNFLEGLDGGAKVSSNFPIDPVRAAESVTNPFSATPEASTELDFSFLGSKNTSLSAPDHQLAAPGSGTKSSALANRLAHGKRTTQEDARKKLGFNAGAFTNTGQSTRISLKTVTGTPLSSMTSGEPTVDDFVAGNAVLAPVDDLFTTTQPNPPAPTSSNLNDIFW